MSVEPLYIQTFDGGNIKITDSSFSNFSLEDIINGYRLDKDKVNNWWNQNINLDEDEVRVADFKQYVRNLDKEPKEKKIFI
jgi:hypothetical protein